MNSSIFITPLSLVIVGALAYFAAVGFRGSGKNEETPANLTKYKSDDELETKHLDKSLSWAVLIASLLTIMIAQVCGLEIGEFIHTFGDVHLYNNHLEQAKEQLSRDFRSLPVMKINPSVKNINNFKFEDFELLNYDPHPHIKAAVSI